MKLVMTMGSAVLALLVAVLSAVLPASAAFADPARREPVILVHGWAGSSADMSALRDAFTAAGGACFHEIAGVEHVDEPRSAPFIAAALAATGGTCPGTFVELPNI